MKMNKLARQLIVLPVALLSGLSIVLIANLSTSAGPLRGEESFYLTNATLIDLDNNKLIPEKTLYINNGKIHKISSQTALSPNLKSWDLKGRFVLPGLIDTHVHLLMSEADQKSVEKNLHTALRNGVTSVKDMAGNIEKINALNIRHSPNIYTSVLVAGESFFNDRRAQYASFPFAAGKAPWQISLAKDSLVNEERLINAVKSSGAQGIKLYADLTEVQVKNVTTIARKNKLPVWGHATLFPVKTDFLIEQDISAVSHLALMTWQGSSENKSSYHETPTFPRSPVSPKDEKILSTFRKMSEKQVALEPTIGIFTHGDRNTQSPIQNWMCQSIKVAEEMEVPIITGSDALIDRRSGKPGIIWELQVLVKKCGLSPHTVLRGATYLAADSMGLTHKTGRLSPGLDADLLILNKNPLKDIDNIQSTYMVFKSGKLVH